ncbi:hypothetical protein J4210_04905 [Candidatus Woesearchaeota archaeon]|nr:hypothetical protein [Candidatus Woesearchaeota archaeon]
MTPPIRREDLPLEERVGYFIVVGKKKMGQDFPDPVISSCYLALTELDLSNPGGNASPRTAFVVEVDNREYAKVGVGDTIQRTLYSTNRFDWYHSEQDARDFFQYKLRRQGESWT